MSPPVVARAPANRTTPPVPPTLTSPSVAELRAEMTRQENYVAMLRRRKEQREELARHIRQLLRGGNTEEVTAAVEELFCQAEQQLRADGETTGVEECEREVREGLGGAAADADDAMSLIFHSGVTAQLASISDEVQSDMTAGEVLYTDLGAGQEMGHGAGISAPPLRSKKKRRGRGSRHQDPAVGAAGAAPGDASRAALMAAVDAFEYATRGGDASPCCTGGGGESRGGAPEWLAVEEAGEAEKEVVYSDDFDTASEATTEGEEIAAGEPESESKRDGV